MRSAGEYPVSARSGSTGRRTGARRAFLGAVLAFLAVSCPGDWIPSGTARVLGWHDEEIAGVPSCVAYLEIENSGSVRIYRASLSMRVYTAARSYYRTLVLDTLLPPGQILYAETSVAYADPAESAESEGGVELVSAYFE